MARAPVGTIAIVGYGLIGASLGQALRARDPSVLVHAIDLPPVLALVNAAEPETTTTDARDEAMVRARLAESDLTVLAGPISVILDQLPIVLGSSRRSTDCGSTKRVVAERARALGEHVQFVPGHPMAGKSSGGFQAARPDLFEGRRWILCPQDVNYEAFDLVSALVRFVGAEPVSMDAAAHDAAVALTSHLPKLLAGALTRLCDLRNAGAVRGPAFERITQGAGDAFAIWKDILRTNPDRVAEVARELAAELNGVAEQLERGDLSGAELLLLQKPRN